MPNKKRLVRGLKLLLLLYVALCALMYGLQRDLLYHPAARTEAPALFGLQGAQAFVFEQPDGAVLHYWFQPPARADLPLIVFFHGNAGSLANRAAQLSAFAQTGMGYAIFSYRGFGQSTGKPTEETILFDAETFLDRLMTQHFISQERMILFGESLGTGVAVAMAQRRPTIAAVVLQSPYISVRARAQELYPWLPVRLLLKDTYDSLKRIEQVHVPLLIFHGLKDDVIPPAHGKTLFNAAHEPKELQLFEQVHHSDFPPDVIALRVLDFVQAQQ